MWCAGRAGQQMMCERRAGAAQGCSRYKHTQWRVPRPAVAPHTHVIWEPRLLLHPVQVASSLQVSSVSCASRTAGVQVRCQR